jgi:acyl carrier protein
MNNLEKYKKAFVDALSIDETKLGQDLKFNDIPEWDSIGHMTLVSQL